MFLNLENIDIPFFEAREDLETWLLKYSGIRLWHATRAVDINDIRIEGLKVPVKHELDDRLLKILQSKPWYTDEVESIIRAQPLDRGESPAVYTVVDKNDLSLSGVDHYKKYGSEYWQFLLNVLFRKGYGVGREMLCELGCSYILGLDIKWKELCFHEKESLVDSIYENDIHNCSIALFQDVSAEAVSSIEKC